MAKTDPATSKPDRLCAESHTVRIDDGLPLQSGERLAELEIACETYGRLSPARDNAILVLHGLTADQHAAGGSGWWDVAIGPGKAIDTDKYYVVSPNVIGGARGSTGPGSPDPANGKPFGLRFPVVTVGDMARAHLALLDRFGIERLHMAVGGCLGGFQVLELLTAAPERVGKAAILSATARTSAHNTALWAVLRAGLKSDPNWNGGDYYEGPAPKDGLGLLAMTGALFWMSRDTLQQRFGIRTSKDAPRYTLEPDFAVEEFFDTVRANAPKGRLDANSLIYLTRAIDYFDLARDHGSLEAALAGVRCPVLLVSYALDWRYPSDEIALIGDALPADVECDHVVLDSTMGHGAFLYEFESLRPVLSRFVAR